MRYLEDIGYIDLFFGDESHFSLTPYIPYAWQLKSTQICLPSSKGKALNVIGAMSRKGKLIYDIHDTTVNSDIIIAFVDNLCAQITKKTILVLDNAPIHRSKKFKARMKEWQEQDLHIYFITPYSPELNIIEILWKHIKYFWLDFKAYDNYISLRYYLQQTLESFGSKYIINFA